MVQIGLVLDKQNWLTFRCTHPCVHMIGQNFLRLETSPFDRRTRSQMAAVYAAELQQGHSMPGTWCARRRMGVNSIHYQNNPSYHLYTNTRKKNIYINIWLRREETAHTRYELINTFYMTRIQLCSLEWLPHMCMFFPPPISRAHAFNANTRRRHAIWSTYNWNMTQPG